MSEQTTLSAAKAGDRAPTHVAIPYKSKCRFEEKDHDDIGLKNTGSTWYATVCDGATQSIRSAEAAKIISDDPPALWIDGTLSRRVELLHQRRKELLASTESEPVDETSYLSRTFAQILRDKRRHAFQTTFVSVRITPLAERRIQLDSKTCGDSALLVFDRRGHLILSTPELAGESSPFNHASPLTEVLPDHFRDDGTLEKPFEHDVHVILCSDGFYDAFPNPGALFRWLLLNGATLCGDDAESAFDELHARLDRDRGDDDMSFVWFCPRTLEPPREQPQRLLAGLPPQRLLVAFTGLLRRAVEWLARRIPTVSGGIAA